MTSRQTDAFTANPERVIDRWPRPDEVTGGWTKGLSIWIPQGDVSAIDDDDQSEEGVTWLPEPAVGWATGIHVVVAKPDRGFVPLEDSVPFHAFTLANSEVVIVLRQPFHLRRSGAGPRSRPGHETSGAHRHERTCGTVDGDIRLRE